MKNYYGFKIFLLVLFIFTGSFFIFDYGYILILLGICLHFFLKHSLDYNETESRKSLDHLILNSPHVYANNLVNTAGLGCEWPVLNNGRRFVDNVGANTQSSYVSEQLFPLDMWGRRRQLHSPPRRGICLSDRLNSTMPALSSSPLVTRQRNSVNGHINESFLSSSRSPDGKANKSIAHSATGPLLSSPFMPQIKRALGLEPSNQSKYR